MPVVYIAGPFRGKTPWQVAQNVRRAEEVAFEVAKLGAMYICPHTNSANFDGELTAEFWIDGTLELLSRCDAMVVQGDFESSSGTMGEIAFADAANLPIFYASLSNWRSDLTRCLGL